MQFHYNTSLKPYHTFGIDQKCQQLAIIESLEDLKSVYADRQYHNVEKLMLGKGSNMLFTEPYKGLVLINRIKGISHRQDNGYHYLHVAAGEDWPQLVEWSVEQSIAGLENLAMIPGCAGSAPIQNIGAYGVELKDVCEYVDYLCLESLTVKRINNPECLFGYRDSIFKHDLYQKAVIVALGLKLSKQWLPKIQYGPLKELGDKCTPEQVYQQVCHIRGSKLPDPNQQGNAGSFFKNPVISQEQYQCLKQKYPDMVSYPTEGGVKLAAGWLIDQAGLKGESIGGAQVHPNQALVIINRSGQATASDVINLAAKIRNTVHQLYGVELEHEVRFMAAEKETYLNQLVEK